MPHQTDLLYHYTSATGLLGILSEKALHASDIRHLNDLRELVLVQDQTISEVDRLRDAEAPTSAAAGRLGALWAALVDYKNEGQFGPFVVSFCEDGDLLSQWRGYGSGGYAIGLSREALSVLPAFPPVDRSTGEPWESGSYAAAPVELRQVRYDSPGASEVIAEIVNHAKNGEPEQGFMPPSDLHTHTFRALATLKDAAFREEREWRLVVMGEGGLLRESFKSRTSGEILPYVPVPLDLSSALKEIIIGPGLYVRGGPDEDGNETWPGGRDVVQRLLTHHQLRGVDVRFSDIPFRGAR
jgi:hypothetical protein